MSMEKLSETREFIALKKKVEELERAAEQKELIIEFKDRMITVAEELHQIDIKNKFFDTTSTTSDKSDKV